MKCRYVDFDCPYVNTSGMTRDKECEDCEHFKNRVRPTGALPWWPEWRWLNRRFKWFLIGSSVTLLLGIALITAFHRRDWFGIVAAFPFFLIGIPVSIGLFLRWWNVL